MSSLVPAHAHLRRLRLAVERRVAPLRLALVTFRALRRLQRTGTVHVLVDTTVLAAAVLHESMWISTGKQPWGNTTVDTGYLARVPVHRRPPASAPPHERRNFEDACYLVGLAHLARQVHIKLHTSGELRTEKWLKPTGLVAGHTLFSRSVFDGIDILSVDGMPEVKLGQLVPAGSGRPSLKERQRERLRQSTDRLFVALRRRLGEKSSQDAWHVRTAEVHGMYCLLTTDYTLMRQLEAQRKHEPISSLRTKVLSPSQLGKELGLLPLNPRCLSHADAHFPVRPDVHLRSGRRKPGSRNP